MIRVQTADFDAGAEIEALVRGGRDAGALVTFIGLVRDLAEGSEIRAMTLEHYPGMTEKALREVDEEAHRRWPIQASLVIHRVGRLRPGDRIVLVAVAAAHRQAAFDAAQFLIDYLKTRAPFWKREETPEGAHWVEAKEADDAAAERWARQGA